MSKRYKRTLKDISNNRRSQNKKEFIKTIKKMERETNKRLEKLNKIVYSKTEKVKGRYTRIFYETPKKYDSNTWASRSLFERLEKYRTGNKIMTKKLEDKSMQELKYIYSSYDKFLESQTSTIRGLQEKEKDTIDTLTRKFDIDKEDAEEYYDMLKDEDFSYFISNNDFDFSDLVIFMNHSIEKNLDKSKFTQLLYTYSQNSQFDDVREKASKLYDKYL